MPAEHGSSIEVWVDSSCPWAWQTARWMIDLRDQGIVQIEWHLFSLEVNASEPDSDFWAENRRHGEAHTALMLAMREGGPTAFERLYLAIGHRLHDLRDEVSPDTFRGAVADAGMPDILEHAADDPTLVDDVLASHKLARDRSVFGVPTIVIEDSKPLFGPIISLAPLGEEASTWWEHVSWLITRPDFFEMKRWPRDLKPGVPAGS
jgi:Mycothiol-dependent nitroreductase Rv2466c